MNCFWSAPLLVSLLGAPPELPKSFDLTAVDTYIAGQVKAKGFVGLSVAVMRDGKIVFAKGYGQRSIEKNLPVEPGTSFAVGSITKQFTCACVLLLAEQGKLSIDDPVSKYYPNLTRAKDITLRDLMNHTAGYPDYYPLDFVDRRMLKPISTDALLKEYAGGKLDFEPGARFSYSNTGYILLGGVVEKVSGASFGTFVETRLLKPLKMEHARFGSSAGLSAATGYTAFALGAPEPAEPEAGGWIDAAGGLWASASDLLQWDLALTTGKVLKPESYKVMTAPRTLTTGKVSNYACGLQIATVDGNTVLEHTGGVSGFVSANTFIPRARTGIVVLSNTEHVSTSKLRGELFRLLLKDVEARDVPPVPKVAGVGPKEAVLGLIEEMTGGKVDRTKLGEEYSVYLTDERVKTGGARLKALGAPEKVEVRGTYERGGMEVATVILTYKTATVRALLYRTPDGKIQQLLYYAE
ncbi:beta-lactamase family protein [Gemmata sp. G18]|uniref:Beta-lactamase family protein n=1 Tax=Gemmata palustris TaxID=2822762 RepID=A0ABS5BTJ9_9BACT|nr:serine hydrolase domain-containing protein [Gemmata palustris]MBP3957019.1 beta-lactamase family protein [Gemmata palustris]